MTTLDYCRQQDEIVQVLAGAVRQPCQFVAVDVEIDVINGEQTEDCVMISYAKRFWRLVPRSERLPYELFDQFGKLRDLMAQANGDCWKSCRFVFDHSGRYRFEFKYDQPLRLNGSFDANAMLANFDPVQFLNQRSL
jgi:hypothetical protein